MGGEMFSSTMDWEEILTELDHDSSIICLLCLTIKATMVLCVSQRRALVPGRSEVIVSVTCWTSHILSIRREPATI